MFFTANQSSQSVFGLCHLLQTRLLPQISMNILRAPLSNLQRCKTIMRIRRRRRSWILINWHLIESSDSCLCDYLFGEEFLTSWLPENFRPKTLYANPTGSAREYITIHRTRNSETSQVRRPFGRQWCPISDSTAVALLLGKIKYCKWVLVFICLDMSIFQAIYQRTDEQQKFHKHNKCKVS